MFGLARLALFIGLIGTAYDYFTGNPGFQRSLVFTLSALLLIVLIYVGLRYLGQRRPP